MSHTPQQPADGWQPPQNQPPVYRPNEQPPTEEPPPWSPESQRMSQSGPQGSVEEDGTVKYVGGPGQPQVPPGYGPPPGVPVSPFDAPPQSPQHMPAADPFGGGGGYPVSGMPAPGMPPVSSIPASGMPVSGMPVSAPGGPGQYGQPHYGQQPPFGGGQFGPQGGQLVPVSGGGAQPWGAPDAIKRKKKGGKGPMWLLLVAVIVIAVALGAGGFILFNPLGGDEPENQQTGTITDPSAEIAQPPAGAVRANEASGLTVLAGDQWAENAEVPVIFTDATGLGLADGTTLAYFGTLDAAALGVTEDSGIGDLDDAFNTQLATHLGGTVGADVVSIPYRVDARAAEFRAFTVGDMTVLTALIETEDGYVGFAGFATADQVPTVEALRSTLSFGS